MIKNDQREVLSFGSSMGCYLSLAQVFLEVACGMVHLSNEDKGVKYELLHFFMML